MRGEQESSAEKALKQIERRVLSKLERAHERLRRLNAAPSDEFLRQLVAEREAEEALEAEQSEAELAVAPGVDRAVETAATLAIAGVGSEPDAEAPVNMDDLESLLGDLELEAGTDSDIITEPFDEAALDAVDAAATTAPVIAPAAIETTKNTETTKTAKTASVSTFVTEPVPEKVTEPAPKPISKIVTKPRRGSKTADENSIEVIRWLNRIQDRGVEGPTLVAPLPALSLSSMTPVWTLPAWEHLGPRAKGYLLHIAANRLGGRAVTVRFGLPALERAKAQGEGFMNFVTGRIDRAFQRHLGRSVPSCFVLESFPGGVAHLHGFACASANEEEIANAALGEAVGEWTHRRGSKHQFVWKDRADDDGPGSYQNWGVYVCKGMGRTKKRIPGRLIATSREITREAKRLHSEYKALQQAIRKAARRSKSAAKISPALSIAFVTTLDSSSLTSSLSHIRGSTPSPTGTHPDNWSETPAGASTPVLALWGALDPAQRTGGPPGSVAGMSAAYPPRP